MSAISSVCTGVLQPQSFHKTIYNIAFDDCCSVYSGVSIVVLYRMQCRLFFFIQWHVICCSVYIVVLIVLLYTME